MKPVFCDNITTYYKKENCKQIYLMNTHKFLTNFQQIKTISVEKREYIMTKWVYTRDESFGNIQKLNNGTSGLSKGLKNHQVILTASKNPNRLKNQQLI